MRDAVAKKHRLSRLGASVESALMLIVKLISAHNSLPPVDNIWCYKSLSTLVQLKTHCLSLPGDIKPSPAPMLNHHQWCPVAFAWNVVFTGKSQVIKHFFQFSNNTFIITATSPIYRWVKKRTFLLELNLSVQHAWLLRSCHDHDYWWEVYFTPIKGRGFVQTSLFVFKFRTSHEYLTCIFKKAHSSSLNLKYEFISYGIGLGTVLEKNVSWK